MKNTLKKMSYLVAVAGLAGSVSVNAAPGISYNYAALQYIDQDVLVF